MKKTFVCLYALVALFGGSVTGCSGYSVTGGPGRTVAPSLRAQTDNAGDLLKINSIAVLPPSVVPTGGGAPVTDQRYYELLQRVVAAELDLELFAGENVNDLLSKQSGGEPQLTGAPPKGAALRSIGERLGADAILVTEFRKLVERVGSSLGVSRAAEVDFTIRLIRVSDGKQVWEGQYLYRDQALSDNLFRIGERLREVKESDRRGWLSAEQIINRGFNEALKDLRDRRLAIFSTRTVGR